MTSDQTEAKLVNFLRSIIAWNVTEPHNDRTKTMIVSDDPIDKEDIQTWRSRMLDFPDLLMSIDVTDDRYEPSTPSEGD